MGRPGNFQLGAQTLFKKKSSNTWPHSVRFPVSANNNKCPPCRPCIVPQFFFFFLRKCSKFVHFFITVHCMFDKWPSYDVDGPLIWRCLMSDQWFAQLKRTFIRIRVLLQLTYFTSRELGKWQVYLLSALVYRVISKETLLLSSSLLSELVWFFNVS